MSPALIILRKLRNFQLETEELKLQQKLQAEQKAMKIHAQARQAVIDAVNFKEKTGFGAQFIHIDSYLQEAGTIETTRLQEFQISQKDRFAQTENTLKAKQKLDMVDRLIQHRREDEQAAADLSERKTLDDIAQAQFMLNKAESMML